MRLLQLILSLGGAGALADSVSSFDYIIVGAGTSGLVVANRLSEDPTVTVVVIEPGTDQRDNINVTGTDRFTQAFDTSIDWNYSTVNQTRIGDRPLVLHQGRAWGGTSTINGMTYVRGDKPQFDAWEGLGNPGWNWDSLLAYYKKSENYTAPTQSMLAAGATFQSRNHGFAGHVHVGYVDTLANGSFAPPMLQTWAGLGLPHNPDLNSGDVHGYSMGPQTLDTQQDVRWDAARAYLYPVLDRKNLKVLKGTVKRITWTDGKRKDCVVASGVEYLDDTGAPVLLKANKEVVVSAGAFRTPLVLEGSGIGSPSLLKSLNIPLAVSLPGVGENMVEQPNHVVAYASTLDSGSPSAYHSFVTMAELLGGAAAAASVAASTRALLPTWAQAAVDAAKASGADGLGAAAVEKLLGIQHDLLFKRGVTAAELITVVAAQPGSVLMATNFWILMPFSRGAVHLGDKDKINEPKIDPRFFLADFDLNATIAAGRYAQKYWFSSPISQFRGPGLVPGDEALPANASDAQWESYARASLNMNSHSIGSAAMMSRSLGGVVDPELRVYGTANVRVVDASVLPTQISGHLTATLYAVAEKASDIIKKTAW